MKRICIFCGSASGNRPEYVKIAAACGAALARAGIGVVFGGGKVGLMGAVADGALAERGEIIGIIPRALRDRELCHPGVADMRVTGSMHERKMLMHDLSDGFIALPGGLGTLDELFETLTWLQLGYHKKPVGILNINDFYGPLLAMLDHAAAAEFIRPEHRAMLLVAGSIDELLQRMREFQPPGGRRWIQRADT
ncbi:MAG: TIGR00730 family Rossman fold protein [Planctomycetes bacterium]|nr:TIGR00730 family Rossman fold protein [Planctomycetota bacterium]